MPYVSKFVKHHVSCRYFGNQLQNTAKSARMEELTICLTYKIWLVCRLSQTYANFVLTFDTHAKCHFLSCKYILYESNFTGHYTVGCYSVNLFTFDMSCLRSFCSPFSKIFLVFIVNTAFACRPHPLQIVAKFWIETNQMKEKTCFLRGLRR